MEEGPVVVIGTCRIGWRAGVHYINSKRLHRNNVRIDIDPVPVLKVTEIEAPQLPLPTTILIRLIKLKERKSKQKRK